MKNKITIISIRSEGFFCRIGSGPVSFIDFEICRKNFAIFMKHGNGLSEEETLKIQETSRCVAIRDASANPMYIEFLWNPPIRLTFKKGIFNGGNKSFSDLDRKINAVGWKTFDIS
jgi:hypothetical protein